ncbi:MAG: hypothetical protein M0Z41_13570 [Peptococcaceae bacterium]|jgi:hypothetical protein|nr:hypothetical protein [Peptococcaceae bacterium]
MGDRMGKEGTELFTVRLWREMVNGDRGETRGEVRHVVSGETRYFGDRSVLEEFLRDMLSYGREADKPPG